MTGTVTQIKICGAIVSLGDYMKVQYTTGDRMKGGQIEGKVVELWSSELSEGHLQGRLSCGWCFHDYDRILEHTPNTELN